MFTIDRDRWRILSAHLDEALDLDPEARAAWLESLRSRDAELAIELQTLLERKEQLGREGFLSNGVSILRPELSLAGQQFGAYTLEAPIGQGGTGSVWRARRSDGRFEGKVAIKLLNAALVGRASEERFRREGSMLARLSHPNIARLIDAGVSSGGQPYLVLENVDGERIDRYCDAVSLSVEARLRIFLDVLAAIAHAHAHLIVHRDIKPSNVLVTGEGAVKVLDFGIAKLLEDDKSPGEATELTREAGRALTPEYAAPEQVLGAPVTTATDVFALGVLLYALLGGQHPAGQSTRSPADLMKAIVDVEAPRLSQAVVSTHTLERAVLTENAARRATTPEKLRRALHGDLENIVAKALKKRPQERYASVTEFADDVRRFMKSEPVRAQPDSLAYRTRKFVRRNRIAVSLAALAVLAVCVGLAGTITQAQRATRQAAIAETQRHRADLEARRVREQRDFALRQLSRAEAINDLNEFVLTDAAPSGKPFTVGDLLGRAVSIVERQYAEGDANRVEMLIALGRQYSTQDEDARARELLARAYELSSKLADPSTRARAACAFARELPQVGETERAERLIRDALAELPEEPQYALDRIQCLSQGSGVAQDNGDLKTSVDRMLAATALLDKVPFPSAALQMQTHMNLAESYRMAGRNQEAAAAFKDAYALMVALGRENTQRAGTLFNNWALVVDEGLGQPLEAEALFRRAIEISSADAGESQVSPMLLNNLARTLAELGRLPEAAKYAERAYATARKVGHEIVVNQSLAVRATIYREQGNLARARAMLAEVEPRIRKIYPPGHGVFASLALHEARLAHAHGDFRTAKAHADRSLELANATGRTYLLPPVLLARSAIALQLARPDEAYADAARALELVRESSAADSPSSRLGEALLAVANALLKQGEYEKARAAALEAVGHLGPALGADHAMTRAAGHLADEAARAAPADS